MQWDYALVADYGVRASKIFFLSVGGYWVVNLMARRTKAYLAHIYPDELRLELVARVISYAMLFVILAAIFHELGLNVTAFLGAAGVVGIAIGYAAQTSLANIISGLFLMIELPFEIGDELVIETKDIRTEGCVTNVNLFSVILQTPSGAMVRVPHEQLLKNAFTNVTRFPVRRYNFSITVESKHTVADVMHMVEEIVTHNSWSLRDKKPYLELVKVNGYTFTLAVGVWGTHSNMVGIQKHVPVELKAALEQKGVTLSAFYLGHDKGN